MIKITTPFDRKLEALRISIDNMHQALKSVDLDKGCQSVLERQIAYWENEYNRLVCDQMKLAGFTYSI